MIKGICEWNFCGNILAQIDAFWRLGSLVTWILWLFWNERRATIKSHFWNSFTIIQSLQKDRGNREPYGSPPTSSRASAHLCVLGTVRLSRGQWPGPALTVPLKCMSTCEGLTHRSVQNPSSVLKMLPFIYLPSIFLLLSLFCPHPTGTSPLFLEVLSLPGEFFLSFAICSGDAVGVDGLESLLLGEQGRLPSGWQWWGRLFQSPVPDACVLTSWTVLPQSRLLAAASCMTPRKHFFLFVGWRHDNSKCSINSQRCCRHRADRCHYLLSTTSSMCPQGASCLGERRSLPGLIVCNSSFMHLFVYFFDQYLLSWGCYGDWECRVPALM